MEVKAEFDKSFRRSIGASISGGLHDVLLTSGGDDCIHLTIDVLRPEERHSPWHGVEEKIEELTRDAVKSISSSELIMSQPVKMGLRWAKETESMKEGFKFSGKLWYPPHNEEFREAVKNAIAHDIQIYLNRATNEIERARAQEETQPKSKWRFWG